MDDQFAFILQTVSIMSKVKEKEEKLKFKTKSSSRLQQICKNQQRYQNNEQRDVYHKEIKTKNTANTERGTQIQKSDSLLQFEANQEQDIKILHHKKKSNCNYMIKQVMQLIELTKIYMIQQQKKQYRKDISNAQCQVRKLKIGFRSSKSKIFPEIQSNRKSFIKLQKLQNFKTQKTKLSKQKNFRLQSPPSDSYFYSQNEKKQRSAYEKQNSNENQKMMSKTQIKYQKKQLQKKIIEQKRKNIQLSAKINNLQKKQVYIRGKIYALDKQIENKKEILQIFSKKNNAKNSSNVKTLKEKKQILIAQQLQFKTYLTKKQNKLMQHKNLLKKQIQTIIKKIQQLKNQHPNKPELSKNHNTKISKDSVKKNQNFNNSNKQSSTPLLFKKKSKISSAEMYGLSSLSKLRSNKSKINLFNLNKLQEKHHNTKHKLKLFESPQNFNGSSSYSKNKIVVTKRYQDLTGRHKQMQVNVFKPQSERNSSRLHQMNNQQLDQNMRRLFKKYNSQKFLAQQKSQDRSHKDRQKYKISQNQQALLEYFGEQKQYNKEMKLKTDTSEKTSSDAKNTSKEKCIFKQTKHKKLIF